MGIDTRKITQDVKLPDGSIMPAGMQFQIDIANTHLDEDTWGVDAKNFDPTRWFNLNDSNRKAHFSFASGKRNCVGQKFAIQEIKIFLLRLCDNCFVEYKGEVMNQMEGV